MLLRSEIFLSYRDFVNVEDVIKISSKNIVGFRNIVVF